MTLAGQVTQHILQNAVGVNIRRHEFKPAAYTDRTTPKPIMMRGVTRQKKPRGYDKARLLKLLRGKQLSADDIREQLHLTRNVANALIRRLMLTNEIALAGERTDANHKRRVYRLAGK